MNEKEIMTLEPKNITFGKREYSELQENIMTCISDSVQKHVTKEKPFQRDLFNQPEIEIDTDDASTKNNKVYVIKEAKKLIKADFTMKWVHPETHETTETTATILSAVHDVKNSSKVKLTINVWALPFILYYGKGVGGTRFNKYLALRIKGKYSKRIYKMLSANKDVPFFPYPISQLKTDFGLADDFSNSRLKQAILEPAKNELIGQNADVWFDYELKASKKTYGRKPKADTINFYVKVKHPREVGGDIFKKYQFVYTMIHLAFKSSGDVAQRSADKIHELGKLEQFFSRFSFWQHEYNTQKKTLEHVNNSIKKMIREECGISK